MKSQAYIIGIDVGTTSTKTVLFTTQGEAVAQSSLDYPLASRAPGTAEQNPDQLLDAVVKTIKTVVTDSGISPKEIQCLSLGTAMHSLMAVDHQGNLLMPMMTWADNRSDYWANVLKDEYDSLLYSKTGIPIHSMSPLVKIVWLREEYPEIFQQTAKFISIKEYILYRFFNEYVVDYSVAAATGLFNLFTLQWDAEALAVAGIQTSQLSSLVPTTHLLKGIATEYSQAMQLPSNIPLVIGASDGTLSNLGVGAITPEVMAITIGTSGALRSVVKQPQTHTKARLFCYPLIENYWVMGGAVNSGGIILQWLRDNLAQGEVATAKLLGKNPYDILGAIAQTVPAGSNGLIFHPYLSGERAPLWNAQAKGSFFGLTLQHQKAHLIRAVFEGIIYNLSMVFQSLQEVTGKPKALYATGGFTGSPVCQQILADVFDCEVVFPEHRSSSCLGAAILGLYALGEINSLEMGIRTNYHTPKTVPIQENVIQYRKMLPVYWDLVQTFSSVYTRLEKLNL